MKSKIKTPHSGGIGVSRIPRTPGKLPRISVSIPEDCNDFITNEAKKRGITISKYASDILCEFCRIKLITDEPEKPVCKQTQKIINVSSFKIPLRPVEFEILKFIDEHPGLSINKIGTGLSGEWCSSYIRTITTELIAQNYLENTPDGSGRCKFNIHLTPKGVKALNERTN